MKVFIDKGKRNNIFKDKMKNTKLVDLIDSMTEAEYLTIKDMTWVAERIREFAAEQAEANTVEGLKARLWAWQSKMEECSKDWGPSELEDHWREFDDILFHSSTKDGTKI